MKLAVTGKGGVGKTTLTAALALLFSEDGSRVVAIDADPDSNLAATLEFPDPEGIVPISEMKNLIDERVGKSGSFFKLNPKVDDIPEKYCPEHRGIKLLVMGRVKKGGGGCACPENTFLKALLTHLLVVRDEIIILDMEAGVEHLGRGTASNVDGMIIVVEPDKRSLETAYRIKDLAEDLLIKNIFIVGNKIHDRRDSDFIKTLSSDFDLLGFIPYDEQIVARRGTLSFDEPIIKVTRKIKKAIEERIMESAV